MKQNRKKDEKGENRKEKWDRGGKSKKKLNIKDETGYGRN
jgi:hypothetical protein